MDAFVAVRYGLLRRVVGRAVPHEGFVFVPAWFSFDAEPCVPHRRRGETPPAYPLREFAGDRPPAVLAGCRDGFGEPADAAWVRARLPAVFRFAPATLTRPGYKYSLVEHVFLACQPAAGPAGWEAVPFVCVSHELRTGLAFSPDGPAEELRRRISAAFWGLLLRDPEALSSYRDGYLSVGYDDGWVAVECPGDRFLVDDGSAEEPSDEGPP